MLIIHIIQTEIFKHFQNVKMFLWIICHILCTKIWRNIFCR